MNAADQQMCTQLYTNAQSASHSAEQASPERIMAAHPLVGSGCGECEWHMSALNPAMLAVQHAAHVRAALKTAGHVIVEVPHVARKGQLDTDASAFRQVAQNLDRNLYAGGSNVRRAVATLLRNVAAAMTDDKRTTSEIRRATWTAAGGDERG